MIRAFRPLLASLFLSAVISTPSPAQTPKPAPAHGALPLVFERNEGQYPSTVQFLGRAQNYTVLAGNSDLRFELPNRELRLDLGLTASSVTGLAEQPFRTNVYLGAPETFRRYMNFR